MSRARPLWMLLFLSLTVAAVDHSDNPYQGTWLNGPTAGSIDADSDRDWFRIDVQTGQTYRFETFQLGTGMDSVIALFGPDGRRVAVDDDGGAGLASRIDWTAGADGTAYLVVLHYSRSGRGSYRVQDALAAPAPAPTVPVSHTPQPAGQIAGARVFDPKLPGASLQLSGLSGATVELRDATGQTIRTLSVSGSGVAWNGRDGAGRFVTPGPYQAVTSAGQSFNFAVVRLGASEIHWDGSGRAPLMFHRADPSRLRSYLPVDSLGPAWSLSRAGRHLDDSFGAPLAQPALWLDTKAPPRASNGAASGRGFALPVAYRSGATRRALVTLGDRSTNSNGAQLGCGYPLAGTPLRLVFGGYASGEIAPGAQVTVDLNGLGGGVARLDYDLVLRFEYNDGGSWLPVPGEVTVAQRFYVLAAVPSLAPQGVSNTAPYLPWVDVVDRVAGWSNGNAGDAGQVMDTVTWNIHHNSGLRYENSAGAPAYSAGTPWQSTLDMAAFDLRYYGTLVNCTDCANLVSVHARMVGVEAQNLYLGYNFPLHWIKGIGRGWTYDVFNNGSHGFSFHNVATRDSGASIHDACLAVDGDQDPSRSPFSELVPMGMPIATYRYRLSPGSFSGIYLDRSRIE